MNVTYHIVTQPSSQSGHGMILSESFSNYCNSHEARLFCYSSCDFFGRLSEGSNAGTSGTPPIPPDTQYSPRSNACLLTMVSRCGSLSCAGTISVSPRTLSIKKSSSGLSPPTTRGECVVIRTCLVSEISLQCSRKRIKTHGCRQFSGSSIRIVL